MTILAPVKSYAPAVLSIPVSHRSVVLADDLSEAYVMTNRFDVVGVIDIEHAGLARE